MQDRDMSMLGLLPGMMLARNDLIERVRSIEAQLGMGDSLLVYFKPPPKPKPKSKAESAPNEDGEKDVVALRNSGLSWREVGAKVGMGEHAAAKRYYRLTKKKKKRRISPEGEARRLAGYYAAHKRRKAAERAQTRAA